MTARQKALVGHAVALIAIMLPLVPWLTGTFGGAYGYFAALVLYWIGFCIPVILLHVVPARRQALFSRRLERRHVRLLGVLALQVILTAAIAAPFASGVSWAALGIGLAMAVVNGPLEELAWRGGFLARFLDRPRLGFWLGWALFTLWHLPLGLAHGIAYPGGAPALIGGAALLGLLWTTFAWRTGSVFWIAIAHALTNALIFPGVVQANLLG